MPHSASGSRDTPLNREVGSRSRPHALQHAGRCLSRAACVWVSGPSRAIQSYSSVDHEHARPLWYYLPAHPTTAVLTLAASVAGAHEYHSKTPARTWAGSRPPCMAWPAWRLILHSSVAYL